MIDEDDELPEDEEEILVYVEFDGSVAGNTFSTEKLQLDVIGLDGEHPIMQVNGKFYEGTYQDAVGTYMFFEKDTNPPVDDPVFDSIPTLKYCAKTRKVLRMQRIFVEAKTEMLGDSTDADCVPNLETIGKAGIPPKYQKAALDSWQKMRNERMEALNVYLEKQRVRDEKRSQGIEPDSESDDDNPFAMYKPNGKDKKTKIFENRSNTISDEDGNYPDDPEMDDENFGSSEKIESDLNNISTVIDPGPSTSKNSQPWNSPPIENPEEFFSSSYSDNDDTFRINLPNVKGKHRATVQVTKKAKIRKYTKVEGKIVSKKGKKGKKSKNKKNFHPEETNSTELSQGVGEIQHEEIKDIVSDEMKDFVPEEMKKIDPKEAKKIDPKEIEDSSKKEIEQQRNRISESVESLPQDQSNENLSKNTDSDAAEKIKELESTMDKRKLDRQQKRNEKMRHITEKLKKAADELRLKTQKKSDNENNV